MTAAASWHTSAGLEDGQVAGREPVMLALLLHRHAETLPHRALSLGITRSG